MPTILSETLRLIGTVQQIRTIFTASFLIHKICSILIPILYKISDALVYETLTFHTLHHFSMLLSIFFKNSLLGIIFIDHFFNVSAMFHGQKTTADLLFNEWLL